MRGAELPQDLTLPSDVSEKRADARIELLRETEKSFATYHPDLPIQSHQSAAERAFKLVRTPGFRTDVFEREAAANGRAPRAQQP